jgi:hypothetical protein
MFLANPVREAFTPWNIKFQYVFRGVMASLYRIGTSVCSSSVLTISYPKMCS